MQHGMMLPRASRVMLWYSHRQVEAAGRLGARNPRLAEQRVDLALDVRSVILPAVEPLGDGRVAERVRPRLRRVDDAHGGIVPVHSERRGDADLIDAELLRGADGQ